MNLLAHAYLSGRNDGYLIGNFIGDFIKGDPAHPRHGLLPDEITGVRIHRAIDTFTDAHPAVAAVRELLRPRCHKYAGVAVDVFFDHFLATQFRELTSNDLNEFVDWFYQTLRTYADRLPPRAARMAQYMMAQDWVRTYQTTDGIHRALNGLAQRTPYASGLETAVVDLVAYYGPINKHFLRFWPELVVEISQIQSQFI